MRRQSLSCLCEFDTLIQVRQKHWHAEQQSNGEKLYLCFSVALCDIQSFIRNPQKQCVRPIGVILREAPRETIFHAPDRGADRRILIGNARGFSRRTIVTDSTVRPA
jgi:hypothetical protein